MISRAKNRGWIAHGAWSLAVAVSTAGSCRADAGAPTVATAADPSSTTQAAGAGPASPRIPPPRHRSGSPAAPAAARATAPPEDLELPTSPSRAPAAVASAPAFTAGPADPTSAATTGAPSAPTANALPADQPELDPIQGAAEFVATVPPRPAASPSAATAGTPAAAPIAAAVATTAAPVPTPAPTPAPAAAVASDVAAGVTPGQSPGKAGGASAADLLGPVSGPEAAQPDLLAVKSDSKVAQVGCATCGGLHSTADGPLFHEAMGCGSGTCIPGRQPCYPPANECNTVVGAFIQNLYQCLCCPDPCYEPRWVPAAYASFFADYARPRTITRLRYDNLESMTRPDRNQFWIQGAVPTRSNGRRINDLRARIQQFYVYQEIAAARGSFFIEYPYRQINQNYAPTQAGFSDLNFGMKSLLFDCELLQVAFQFRTYTPTGNGSLNLGTGHFSLDPSILTSLKLGPTTYFQGQFGNWIPLAGNQSLAGGVLYWLMSVNQVLWYTTPDSPLIATFEMDGWSFENGGYTAAILPGQKPLYVEKGGGVSYFNIGPGLRQSVCNRLDFGGAITWATSTAHWAQPWFRFEARFLF